MINPRGILWIGSDRNDQVGRKIKPLKLPGAEASTKKIDWLEPSKKHPFLNLIINFNLPIGFHWPPKSQLYSPSSIWHLICPSSCVSAGGISSDLGKVWLDIIWWPAANCGSAAAGWQIIISNFLNILFFLRHTILNVTWRAKGQNVNTAVLHWLHSPIKVCLEGGVSIMDASITRNATCSMQDHDVVLASMW